MIALELPAEIDEHSQIHLQLPKTVRSTTAKVIVLYEAASQTEGWPDGYFDLFGSWQGEPLERAPQGEAEERLPLE
jgi:hypothetical protein